MAKVKQLPRRQRFRRALLLISFLFFPLTLYYFSPALIIQGASEGIIAGSFIVFGLMFLSALFVGRLWCGWLCPAGGLQACATPINNKPTPGGKFNWIKWGIWLPWIAIIAVLCGRLLQKCHPLLFQRRHQDGRRDRFHTRGRHRGVVEPATQKGAKPWHGLSYS